MKQVLIDVDDLLLLQSKAREIDDILKHYLRGMVFKQLSHTEQIEFCIKGICEFYHITEEELTRKVRRGRNVKRKSFATLILHEFAKCNFSEIGRKLNYYSHVTPRHNYKLLKQDLGEDVYGSEEKKQEYKDLLNHLKF